MITCNVAIYTSLRYTNIRTGGAVVAAQATAGGIIPPVKSFNQPSVKSFLITCYFKVKMTNICHIQLLVCLVLKEKLIVKTTFPM